MSETILPEAPITTLPVITTQDREWLESLGVSWPNDQDEAAWIADMNAVIAVGSQDVTNEHDQSLLETVSDARNTFFSKLKSIESGIETRKQWIIPPETFIASQRVFHEYGIDSAKLINRVPAILGLSAENLITKLENLGEIGLDVLKVVERQPSVLSQNPGTIRAKLEELTELGLDAVKVVNAQPKLLGNSPALIKSRLEHMEQKGLDVVSVANTLPNVLGNANETIDAKLDNLVKLGLNATFVVNRQPSVLTSSPELIQKKVQLIRAAGRMWGIDRSKVNEFIEGWPVILGYKPAKIRTLITLANQTLPRQQNIELKDIQSSVIANLEAVVVGYLKNGHEIKEPKDIRLRALAQKKLGKDVLRATIERHQEDPVVKAYIRGYPTLKSK